MTHITHVHDYSLYCYINLVNKYHCAEAHCLHLQSKRWRQQVSHEHRYLPTNYIVTLQKTLILIFTAVRSIHLILTILYLVPLCRYTAEFNVGEWTKYKWWTGFR